MERGTCRAPPPRQRARSQGCATIALPLSPGQRQQVHVWWHECGAADRLSDASVPRVEMLARASRLHAQPASGSSMVRERQEALCVEMDTFSRVSRSLAEDPGRHFSAPLFRPGGWVVGLEGAIPLFLTADLSRHERTRQSSTRSQVAAAAGITTDDSWRERSASRASATSPARRRPNSPDPL